MAENYVSIKIRADDTAKPDLTQLRLNLDELNAKIATAKVKVDDEAASEKLLRLNAKLAELNAKVANPRIKVAGAARAAADILYVEHELDKLKRKADDLELKAAAAGPGGLLGKLLFGIAGGRGPGGGVGGISGALSPGLAGGAGALLGVPVIGALLVELTGLVSGFSAAGAGAAAFYALAHPAINNLQQDVQALSKANQALGYAQMTEQLDPTKKHLAALQAAELKYKAIYAQMGQDAGPAAAGMLRLHDAYVKLSTAFQPQAFRIFNDLLQVANNLLPALAPLATAFANALDPLLKQFAKFTASTGFQDWLKQFASLVGPATTAIGEGVGKVAVAIGKLLTSMNKKDVVNAINIAFTILAGTIEFVGYMVRRLMTNWDSMSSTARRDTHDVASAFDNLRHDIANWGHNIASYFDESRANIARWARDVQRDADNVVRWFQLLPGRILHALGNLGSLLVQAGKDLVLGFIHGIESMFGAIAAAGWGMVKSLGSKVLHILGIHSPSRVAHWWGQMVAQGMADGITEGARLPADAAARMAAGVAGGLGAGGGYGAAGGNGTLRIQLEWVGGGDSAMFQMLREGIRVRGGDPRVLNKKVQFQ